MYVEHEGVLSPEQLRAIKRLDKALKNLDACGMVTFVAEGGTMHIFLSDTVPMDGMGGTVNVEKQAADISTNISAGAY